MIDDNAAGEDHDAVFFGQGDGQFVPMEQITADGMPPTHVAPYITKRVVLVEEMVFAFEEDEAVGIVGPMHTWGEMELRAEGLVVPDGAVLSGEQQDTQGQQCGKQETFHYSSRAFAYTRCA